MTNTVGEEVVAMMAAAWLMLSTLLCSLQLSTGSFPKPLTEEEEHRYLELAQKGDIDARNVLIERNLRLVAHIMKKYYAQTADQEDLISIGTIGLIKGISTFDTTKGARLATYAARCVENAILSQGIFCKGEKRYQNSRGQEKILPPAAIFRVFIDYSLRREKKLAMLMESGLHSCD